MAIITETQVNVSHLDKVAAVDDKAHVIIWGPLSTGDTGNPVIMPYSADRSIQMHGDFAGAGSIQFEGSNDGTNWFVLVDPFNALLTFTAAGLRQILQLSLYVRPKMTAGSATLTATLLLRRK